MNFDLYENRRRWSEERASAYRWLHHYIYFFVVMGVGMTFTFLAKLPLSVEVRIALLGLAVAMVVADTVYLFVIWSHVRGALKRADTLTTEWTDAMNAGYY